MARDGNGVLPARVRGQVAIGLLVVAIVFFVVTAVFGLDLAKPAWGMFFVSIYIIFGNVVGDFLLRVVTGMAATAREDGGYGDRRDRQHDE